MSKQISPAELADVVRKLLTSPQDVGQLEEASSFASFMTQITEAVCDHCGGEVRCEASSSIDGDKAVWYIGVHGNECLPENGGVWAEYDPEGELFDDAPRVHSPSELTASPEASPPTQEQLTAFMRKRIENGDLDGEDLPKRLPRYGLMDPKAFVAEMQERMENYQEEQAKKCDDCGAEVTDIIRCIDGAQICQKCWVAGNH